MNYVPILKHRFPGLLKQEWQINRMELVSLLKFDEPAVYIYAELPEMEKLKEAKVRPLNRFEQARLQVLREDSDEHFEANLNRVKMVGALHSTKSCTDCHRVKQGELLGAFSYDIFRIALVSVEL